MQHEGERAEVSDSAWPVVFFDSGVGGLTILDEARRRFPSRNLVYIADTAFVPYGDKPPHVIVQRADLFADWAFRGAHAEHATPQLPARALVIPCNTATMLAAQHLRARYPAEVIVGVEPGIKPALAMSRAGAVGVWATRNTAQSERFISRIAELQRQVTKVGIHVQPCQGLAEMIERFARDASAVDDLQAMLCDYWSPFAAVGVDTLVLGCTHYPLVKAMIRRVVGEHVCLVETAAPVIDQLCRRLGLPMASHDDLDGPSSAGPQSSTLLSCTGDADAFRRQVTGLCEQGALPSLAASGWQLERISISPV